MEQEMLQKAMMLRARSEEVEKQLGFIAEQTEELEKFMNSLTEIERNKSDEILSGLGRGVYAKSKIKKNEKLFVEVGAGVLVRKTIKETKQTIENQLTKFRQAGSHLKKQLEFYAEEFGKMLKEVEGKREKGK